jgi:murein DD-endopeptidase MepM/ murein hydrolase activator NlpD
MPQPISRSSGRGSIEREELAPPTVAGVAIPAPAPQMANASLSAKIPNTTPPRAGSKFIIPVQGQIISSYGPKAGGLHNDGVNIKAPKGAPVRAAENGVVVYADDMKGYGKMVLIRHADRWMTAYAHLDNIQTPRGTTVRRGQTIGVVGSTGSVSEPQLHFEIRRGTDALNPEKYM